jgi:hypothetical protein
VVDAELSDADANLLSIVMPGLVPGIHVFLLRRANKAWLAGTSPAMTASEFR